MAVVTGGRGDLATAIVRALEADGAMEVRAPGRDELDVTDADSVNRYFADLARVDLLVNNAGILRDGPVQRMAEGAWDDVVNTNLRGVFLCSRAAVTKMVRNRDPRPMGGHVINIGSYSALRGPAGQANYAAAKAGVVALTQSLAKEYGARGIRVNCVLPGFLETKMTAGVDTAVLEKVVQEHTLGRFNTVDEAARFVAFLDSMGTVSGQVFQLDSRVGRWA